MPGFAFTFGWTPCIGPILAAVLVLAANRGTILRGEVCCWLYIRLVLRFDF